MLEEGSWDSECPHQCAYACAHVCACMCAREDRAVRGRSETSSPPPPHLLSRTCARTDSCAARLAQLSVDQMKHASACQRYCACVCVCVCMHACLCLRVCARACVRVRVCVCAMNHMKHASACQRVAVCVCILHPLGLSHTERSKLSRTDLNSLTQIQPLTHGSKLSHADQNSQRLAALCRARALSLSLSLVCVCVSLTH